MSDCKERKQLPNPTNVRLPRELLEQIQKQARRSERTLSQQIRWLLGRAVEHSNWMQEQKER